MEGGDWNRAEERTLGMLIDGSLLLLLNGGDTPVPFTLPPGGAWSVELDTSLRDGGPGGEPTGSPLTIPPQALVLLRAAAA